VASLAQPQPVVLAMEPYKVRWRMEIINFSK
jgi:hypothetical protein